MVVKSLQMMLQRLGYKVTACGHPFEAWAKFEAGAVGIDLLLTDFQMPGMNGLDLSRKCLALRPDLPVFIASGFAGQVTPAAMREAGVRRFFQKPVEFSELAEAVATALRGSGPKIGATSGGGFGVVEAHYEALARRFPPSLFLLGHGGRRATCGGGGVAERRFLAAGEARAVCGERKHTGGVDPPRTSRDRRYAEEFAEAVMKVVWEGVTESTGKGLVIIGQKGEPHPIAVFRKFQALAAAGKLDPAVAARGAELAEMLNHWQHVVNDGKSKDTGDDGNVDLDFEKIVSALPLPLKGVGAKLYQLAWFEKFDDAKVEAKLAALRPADLDRDLFARYDWVFYLPPKGAFDVVLDQIIAEALKKEEVGFLPARR